MNEINKLIWPNDLGIGIMNPDDFQNTAQIALDYKIIKSAASADAYMTDFAEQAVQQLENEGVDVNGADWTAPEVQVTAGGE